jgi:inner membrane protein
MVYGAFVTHVLLDCLTVYGTQILWPLPTPPVMWSTIFIIDPAYSIPLFFGVLTAVVLSRNARLGHGINTACLILTTGYLVWSIGAKVHVNGVAREALERQNVSFDRILTVPTPFNTLLWRVLVMEGSAYREGFYSLLDQGREIRFKQYPSEHNLLDGLESHWPVKRLKWFTHGFFSARQFGSGVVMTDLRMGIEPSYVFSFKVGRVANPHALPTESERVYGQRKWEQLQWVWKRIWTTEPQVADNGLDVASKAGADALTRQR